MFQKKNFALLVASTLFSLLLGELALRLFTPAPTTFNHHQLYCEHDPLLGWRKRPNTEGHHHTGEYNVVEKMNSQGFRGGEHARPKPAGTRRILFLGDSFAEGYTVAFDSLFSEIMQARLQADCPSRPLEVINTGTGGYSTDQEVLLFEQQGKSYQPDDVVLMFCTNDPWFNLQERYYDRGFKPRFVHSADSLLLTNTPVPTMAARPFFTKAKDYLLQHSILVQRLRNLRDALAPRDRQLPVEWRVYQNDAPGMAPAWQLTAALLDRLRQKTAEAGSRLLVFYIPEKIEIHPEAWQAFVRDYPAAPALCDPSLPRRRLSSICDSLDIALLDPTSVFAEKTTKSPGARFYFQHDWHWNPAGNRVVGEALAAYFQCL